jgi:transcriptional regulator with PAS, ATPase and Fis domain
MMAGRIYFLIQEAVLDPDDRASIDFDLADVTASRPGLLTLLPSLAADLADFTRIARENVTVTLIGETGTGKEVLAEALHALSGRRGPFFPINCAAIPKDLIESQLFGHKKGAFTGAADSSGNVRAAEGGTLFLDEIVSTRLEFQVALLRVIQQRQVTPVGSNVSLPVDVRFVAATQVPLQSAVARGTFREDLRARLEGFSFLIPPLRARRVDLGIVTATLLRAKGVDESSNPTLTPEAALRMIRYDWPANIRELEQSLARSWALARDGEIDQAHLPDPDGEIEGPADVAAPPIGQQPARREELIEVLRVTKGDVAEAARRMGCSRQAVYNWMKKWSVDPEPYRDRGD